MGGSYYCMDGTVIGMCSTVSLGSGICRDQMVGESPDVCYDSYYYDKSDNMITLLELSSDNVLS